MNLTKAPEQALVLPQLDVDEMDRRVEEGRTLPPFFYTDPAVVELENRFIFRVAWQLACSEVEVKAPGDFVTLEVASVPIVVIRDDEHRLHAFVNVCRHRAGQVVTEAAGNCPNMRCSYHGWTYRRDGSLQGAPGFEEGLPPFEELGLRSVSIECWAGLVFVSLEPKETLLEQLGDVPKNMMDNGYDFPFEKSELEFTGSYDLDFGCNWKLLQENNSECYHCPTTHPDSFCRVLNTEEIDAGALNGGSFMRFPLREELVAMLNSDGDQEKDGYFQYILWPNAFVVGGHVGEMIFKNEPRGLRDVRLVGRVFQRPGEKPAELTEILEEAMRTTVDEDIAVVEGAQRGFESGYFDEGPVLPVREVILRQFYKEYWSAIRPAFERS